MAELVVWGIHAVRPNEISVTELICTNEESAASYAEVLSGDPGVLGAAITRYHVDQPGRRTAVALFVKGERQEVPWISDNREVLANGWPPGIGRRQPRKT